MFGLSRGQLKNGLILAFVIFLVSQVSKEMSQDFETSGMNNQILPNERASNLVKPKKSLVQIDNPLAGKGKKVADEKGEKLRKERLDLKKQKEALEKERDVSPIKIIRILFYNIFVGFNRTFMESQHKKYHGRK